MSAFNSDRYFRFRQIATGQVIESHRPCRKCGYDLRGLTANRRCPECGTSIAASLMRKLNDEALGDAPPGYLSRLRLGAALLLASPLVLAVLAMVGPLVRKGLADDAAAERFVLSSLLAPGLLWASGCFLLSGPRETQQQVLGGISIWRARRWGLRLTSPAWLGVTACLLWLAGLTNPSPVEERAALASLVAALLFALINAAVLSHYFSLLCAWAYDMAMSRSFALLAWGAATWLITAITYGLVAGNVTLSFASRYELFFGAIGAAVWLAALLYAVWRLADMYTMLTWALRNARTRLAYHDRQRAGRTGVTAARSPHKD